ncbi:MAG: hypothetical protein V3R78_10125 [Thermodesulfobacteriota bacterium]
MSESTAEATTEVQEPTIGKNLFPEQFTDDTETVEEETEAIETEPATKEPVEETKTDEVEYLNIEELSDKVFKLKINGEESTITVKDALRRIQTDKHLTQEGQRLAEERRQLDALKNSVADKSVEPKKESWEEGYEDESTVNPDIADLKAQVATLTDALGAVNQNLAPTVYEQNVKAIDNYLREQGYDDFMVYRPRVEEHFLTYSVEDQAKVSEVDLISKYKDLKIQDMTKSAEQKSTEPAENRKSPAIVNVIGGSSTPSGADEDDMKYSKAFERAQETGDWGPVLKLKGLF